MRPDLNRSSASCTFSLGYEECDEEFFQPILVPSTFIFEPDGGTMTNDYASPTTRLLQSRRSIH